jgi:hypothetical protein
LFCIPYNVRNLAYTYEKLEVLTLILFCIPRHFLIGDVTSLELGESLLCSLKYGVNGSAGKAEENMAQSLDLYLLRICVHDSEMQI